MVATSCAGRRPPRSPVVSWRHVVVGLGLVSLALTFHPGPASAQFFERFDGVTAPGLPPGWTGSGDQPWTTVSTTSDTAPNSAFGSAPGVTSDDRLDSPPLKITSPSAQLLFRNRFDFTGFDGAVLEISSPNVNGGAFTDIVTAGGGFVTGSYTGSISSIVGHPLAGRFVWRGNSGGSFLDTRVNLPAAVAGQTVRLRWRVGTSSSGASVGQFIDGVSITGGGLATDLRLTAAQSADVVPAGGLITYTLTVRNDGPVAGSSALLLQQISSGTTFESLVAPAGWTCSTPAPGGTGTLFCQRPTLPAATLDTFTLVIRVSPTAPDGASILGAPSLTTSPAVADVQNTFAMLAATVSRPGAPARTVTDCGDTGAAGQLRQTIAAADPGDTVLVSACPVIALTAGALALGQDLLLQGAGPGQTALDAGGTSGVLTITAGNVLLTGLTLRNGFGIGIDPGAIRTNGTLTLRNMEISANQGGLGGGIFSSGALTLDRTLVSGNQGDQGGGVDVQGPTLVTNSTLTGNSVSGSFSGGGLTVAASITAIGNSTLSGNSSGAGGGAISSGGRLALTNTTIVGNTAAGAGGGLQAPFGGTTLRNTIVSGNTASAGPNCTGPVLSLGHNLESGTDCGFVAAGDLAGVDPLLGPLQNNGGFTPTHALLAGSPAIDAGDATDCPARDQRGFVRPADGDGTGAAVCDIGAVELLRFQGQLALAVNQPTFRPGDTLRVDLNAVNTGPGAVVDVLFGFVLPVPAASAGCPAGDLVLAFFRPGFSGADVVCSSAPPDRFPLAFETVTFPGPFPATTVPGLVALPLPPGMPPGSYVVFIAVIAAGALEDGRLDPGDLLAVGTAAFAVLP